MTTRVAALGEGVRVEGFALGGALVLVAEERIDVEAAWDAMPSDVSILVLTPAAAAVLEDRFAERPRILPVVMPA